MNCGRRCLTKAGQNGADLPRKIRRRSCWIGLRIDIGPFFQFRKRQVGRKPAALRNDPDEMTLH
jgi:hypothetical protein